jgi:hypothetical protein
MSQWSSAPQRRQQMVLLSQRPVDDILWRVSWTKWEATYHGAA